MAEKTVEANCDNKYWPELNEGKAYVVLNTFPYNGEYYYKVKAQDGTIFEAPSCFFDEVD